MSPNLPVDASDQDSNVGHEKNPAESVEVPPHFRIRLINGILGGISLLMLDRSSSVTAVVIHEMQDDTTAHHHVNDLSRNPSDKETAARIEKSHVAAVACRGNAGDGTSSDLNEDAREVRADEDVRIPLCLEFGVLLAAVEDDVLEYHGNGSRNERRSDEETC